MDSGLNENFPDRMSPIKAHVDGLKSLGAETGPLNPHVNAVTSDVVRVSKDVPICGTERRLSFSLFCMQMFACAAQEHCKKYGTKKEHFAKIASKNRTQGAQNPRAAIQVC